MNFSFHYYGTYCAAREAGFNNDDAWAIAHSAQFVDDCTKELLQKHGFGSRVPTCHSMSELLQMNKGWFGSAFSDEVPQVWTSFHFLPGNYTEDETYRLRYYNGKYICNQETTEIFKLMCLPYSHMTGKIVDKAKAEFNSNQNSHNKKLLYVGMVMHVLADTFSHEYFVGIPSEAINETTWITEYEKFDRQKPYKLSNIRYISQKTKPNYAYVPAFSSTSLGWLGHGRAGTYPDIPNKKYYYTPNWNPDVECFKDNPLLHLCAFQQMTDAMKFILAKDDGNTFDYSKELTADEYNSEYSLKLLEIFNSNGDDQNQNINWIQHIFDSYNQSIIDHNADFLASDNSFLCDFTDNADEHRKLVCRYCRSITPSLKYFDI